jgi:hypothetical protein
METLISASFYMAVTAMTSFIMPDVQWNTLWGMATALKTGYINPGVVGFCLAFGAWLLLVSQVRHFVGLLPAWFQRGDAISGH